MTTFDAAIFDVDGTLFDYQKHQVPDSAVRAVKALRQRGVKVIVASGRSYGLLGSDFLSKIDADYYVMANGHSVLDSNLDELLQVSFSKAETEHVVNTAKQHNALLALKYVFDTCVYSGFDEMYRVFNTIGLESSLFEDCPDNNRHLSELPIGFTIKGSTATALAMQQSLGDLRVELFHDPTEFDIFKPHHNKMTGLRFLFDRIDIDPERCVAFGDSRNDIEMIAGVGWGVAMGNACDELKQRANHICPPSWEDGIAIELQRLQVV